jgi:deoxyribodipyrimidine photo-lyase
VPELSPLNNKDIHAPWLAKNLPMGFQLGRDYPQPLVDHAVQRQKALALFGKN